MCIKGQRPRHATGQCTTDYEIQGLKLRNFIPQDIPHFERFKMCRHPLGRYHFPDQGPVCRVIGDYRYVGDVALVAGARVGEGVDKTWGSCGAFSVCDGQPTIENCGPCDGYSVSPFGRPPHPSALSHAGIGNVID